VDERERVQTDEAKGPPEEDPRIAGEKHPVARMIGIGIFASLIGIAITLLIDWFPTPAADSADKIDTLYDVLLICSVPVFVLVMTIAIYSVVRFRAKPGDMGDGPPIHGNTRLEVIWVTIPFLLVTGLAIYGWVVLDEIEAKDPDELVVNVTGQQFTWTFEYPKEKVKSSELVLPKDRPVHFRIKTKDVIHSFWVPQFRLKSDAVPGITTRIRLTPDRIGNYEVVCAELCGIGHATMRNPVRVLSKAGFDAWLKKEGGGGGGGGAADGKQLFASNGCGGCHALSDAGTEADVGPKLDDLAAEAKRYGKQQKESPEEYVRQSIVDPRAFTVPGFGKTTMPTTFGKDLSKQQVDALVDYLLRVGK
jgi:cytochrome c oxidase subunit 2